MGRSIADVRQRRLEQYETSAAECEMLARLATDQSKQTAYERLAAHYRHIAAGFREALAMHHAALTRLRLH